MGYRLRYVSDRRGSNDLRGGLLQIYRLTRTSQVSCGCARCCGPADAGSRTGDRNSHRIRCVLSEFVQHHVKDLGSCICHNGWVDGIRIAELARCQGVSWDILCRCLLRLRRRVRCSCSYRVRCWLCWLGSHSMRRWLCCFLTCLARYLMSSSGSQVCSCLWRRRILHRIVL